MWGRTSQLENRFDQSRFAIHRDATDLALVVHGHEQRITDHHREIRRLTDSVEEAQARITGLDTFSKKVIDHDHHVDQTIDRYMHSHTASINGIINEQQDLRRLVEDLASRVDRSQG